MAPTDHTHDVPFERWLQTAPGAFLAEWERRAFDRAVVDLFGYHALQLGLHACDTLDANRMPHRWLALDQIQAVPHAHVGDGEWVASSSRSLLLCDFHALPFPEHSLDLVTLPHTLELSPDPHGTLAEVERVLIPEGRVVISGLNPASLWGLRQWRSRHLPGARRPFVPASGEWIGHRRLRDWLRLLNFEVETVQFGCYRPSFESPVWLDRFAWMDGLGRRSWPIFGAGYFLVAVKRVRGMRLMGQTWRRRPALVNAPVSVANKSHRNSR